MGAGKFNRWLASLAILALLVTTGAANALVLDNGYLGVELEDNSEGSKGARIYGVEKGSPAALAGLKEGLRVVKCNSERIRNGSDFIKVLQGSSAGDRLELVIENKEGWEREFLVILGQRKVEPKTVKKAYLGVEIDEAEKGILVVTVRPKSPAAKAGLKAKDLLLEANGKSLKSEDLFAEMMGDLTPGSKLTLRVERNGWTNIIDVKLGSREETTPVPAGKVEEKTRRRPVRPRKDVERGEKEKKRGWLGVRLEEDEDAGHVKIIAVISDSPAEEAGLMAGDILVEIGDRKITDLDSLELVFTAHFSGDRLGIVVQRKGERKELTITLGDKQ